MAVPNLAINALELAQRANERLHFKVFILVAMQL